MSDFEEFVEYIYTEPYNYPARRYLRDASNPLEFYDENEFQKRYRCKKDTIVNTILPLLCLTPNENKRGLPIPPIIQLLIAMRYYATGNFQVCIYRYTAM